MPGWIKLALGLAAIVGLFCALGFLSPPRGPAGELVRRNIAHDVDATHYFYSDVPGIFEMGRDLESRLAD